jgi:hypothetical protein
VVDLIWATRGHSWGFRFLLDGGFANPLPTYETAFVGSEAENVVCRQVSQQVALRFPDPLSRTDAAGRVIPHDFVLSAWTPSSGISVEAGLREIWPMIADVYAQVWDAERAPSVSEIQAAIATGD